MPKAVTTFGILCHRTNLDAPRLLPPILRWATGEGVTILLDRTEAIGLGFPELGVAREEMAAAAEMIVVLGGDGSLLKAVRHFAPAGIPIAGINLGRLGFLTLGLAVDTLKIFQKLRSGQYHLEERMLLEAVVKRRGKIVFRGIAMNDAVIVKAPISRVIDVEVSISGTFISSFRGDGVIFSTPTGSTAYSLSAGGPIIPPWIRGLLLCPLASHTLNARPVVTSDRETFAALLSSVHPDVELVIDGQEGFGLKHNDRIEIACARDSARVVVQQPRNFFKILRQKMKWGR
jgi:NAD+ kinase